MANYVLEILDGDRAGEVLPVAERTLRIGRKPGNDLVLADEKTSGVHAEVVLEGDRHVLRDLGSTNGTFLDGKRVTEIVLTLGDVVTIGRLRVKFRAEGEGSAADAGDLTVRRLDAARLQRRGGSIGLLAGLVVVGLGVAGYFWWQGRQANADENGGQPRHHDPLTVAGNRLAANLAGCESEEGWNLRAAGAGFQPSPQANTGNGAFEATRAEGADAADFAMLAAKEPLTVFGGRTMTIAAHLRTDQGALIAVRAHCFSSSEQVPFHFRSGSPLAAQDSWHEVQAVVAVPPGCDRLQVEVIAVLPGPGAVARVDDVAVTEAGQAAVLEHRLAESGQAAIGNAASLAVRSVDADNPATLLQILPDQVDAALQGLHRAGLCVLSDLGASLACKPTERSFQIEATGPAGSDLGRLQLVVPADAAAALLVAAGDDGFHSAAAESEFPGKRLVLGDRGTRALVQFAAPVACSGHLGGGLYRLSVQSARFELVLGFLPERAQADELLRRAEASRQEGKFGEALDRLRELVRTVPFDSEKLSKAQILRAELLAVQAEALGRFRKDLDEASFFKTRGIFERVVRGVDEVINVFGEQNLEDAAATKQLRDEARASLQQIDGAEHEAKRKRLLDMAQAFTANQQPGLAKLVQDYIDRHLPAAGGTDPKSTGGTDPNKEH